jgi:hypothetical protein
MILIPITIVFLIGVFFEKSDYHLKKEAEQYYNQNFNQNK